MHTTVKVVATDSAVAALLSVANAVTLMGASLSQHCHYHCCHNDVLVFVATALCSFSLSQRYAHRCPTVVAFLPCKLTTHSFNLHNLYIFFLILPIIKLFCVSGSNYNSRGSSSSNGGTGIGCYTVVVCGSIISEI